MKLVMTIDDSISMQLLVARILEQAGYTVVQATDGCDALAKLDGLDVRLFLADLNMPNMDGIELTLRLRSMAEYKFVPIVLLSAEPCAEKKRQGKAAGATAWFVKPFESERLLAVVNKVMR
jgi:two-component system chemotaxis response regulator CheY